MDKLTINTLDDVKRINYQMFSDNFIVTISILGVNIDGNNRQMSYVNKKKLAHMIENKAIREYAIERNIIEASRIVYQHEYASLRGAFIDNKFRASLSDNDKVILMSTYKLSNIAEKLEAKIKGKI